MVLASFKSCHDAKKHQPTKVLTHTPVLHNTINCRQCCPFTSPESCSFWCISSSSAPVGEARMRHLLCCPVQSVHSLWRWNLVKDQFTWLNVVTRRTVLSLLYRYVDSSVETYCFVRCHFFSVDLLGLNYARLAPCEQSAMYCLYTWLN